MALEIPPELLESTKFRIMPIMQDGLDGRSRYICDAEEGDSPRHINVPFPSVPQAPVTQQIIPHYELQDQNSAIYRGLLWNTLALQAALVPPYRPLVSPSPHSSIQSNFEDTFELSGIEDAYGNAYLLRSIGQQDHCASAKDSPQELCNPVSVGAARNFDTIFDYQEYFPSDLLTARGTDLGASTKATVFPYQSYFTHPAFASRTSQTDLIRSALVQPRFPQHSLSTHSLPVTPTQLRCTQRSFSLPSVYESRDFLNVSPPLSQASSTPRPVTANSAYPHAEPTFLVDELVHFPSA